MKHGIFPHFRQDWDRFESLSGKMSREFQVRRSVLLTRLNASVDSFLWSEQGQKNRDQLYKIGLPGKSILGDNFQENRTS